MTYFSTEFSSVQGISHIR